MLSMPPATMMSASPRVTACTASTAAFRPEPQALFTVKEVVSFGSPASRAATRPGLRPRPAGSTWPRITSSTCSGESCARLTASRTAMAPRLVAGCWASAPPSVPIAVRAALTMTALAMNEPPCWGWAGREARAARGPVTVAQGARATPWPRRAVGRRGSGPRIGGNRWIARGPDSARRASGRHRDALALLACQPEHHFHRVLELLHRPGLQQPPPDHVIEQGLATGRAQDRDRPVHAGHAAAGDIRQLGGEVAAVVALRARVLLRLVEAHLHHLAVLPVDQHFALHVELLHVGERDAHLLLDLLDHEALVGEDLGAQQADGEVDDLTEALQELRLPLDVLLLLAAVVEERGVRELNLAHRRHLTGHPDEADALQTHPLRIGERHVVGAVGVPGAGAGDRLVHRGHDLGLRRGGQILVGGRNAGAVEHALAQAVAEDGGHDAAVLAAGEDLGILAAGRDHPAIATEESVVHAGLERQDGIPHVELADAEPGTDLRAHVAADALADAAEIEGRARLGHLLRLALDVVDDVVRADEHARAALAAAAESDHLVHHLLEGDVRHDGRTLAQRCRQRKRRGVLAPSPLRALLSRRRGCETPLPERARAARSDGRRQHREPHLRPARGG